MRVWRLARRRYPVLDGEGARRAGGRWNSPGSAVVYTAGSRALAALELLAYVNPGAEPPDLELFEVHLPDDVPARTVGPTELERDWRAPRHPDCRVRGDTWARSADTLLLVVPSAMIPEEPNYLINPAHPAASRVRVVSSRPFSYDPRLQR
ncbi:MAG: RES family NAD+ phosphorylase [Gemmatimonadetes bacterium]|nr:RES family NAD+ phosphorylase [Gemmatimonadota bacterium]